jgi:hypothetical protein
MNQFETMQRPIRPKRFNRDNKRFNWVEDNKYLRYKFAKESREKKILLDMWAELNREVEKITSR